MCVVILRISLQDLTHFEVSRAAKVVLIGLQNRFEYVESLREGLKGLVGRDPLASQSLNEEQLPILDIDLVIVPEQLRRPLECFNGLL